MNSDQENFEALRKLLALKKYEEPPPRYFSELPGRILNRIEREPQTIPFWERIFPNVSLNPALAYSFGLLACGTLVFGIGYSLNSEPEQAVTDPIADDSWRLASPMPAAENSPGLTFSNYQVNQLASTNPVMSSDPLPSLFDGLNLRVTPVDYSSGK